MTITDSRSKTSKLMCQVLLSRPGETGNHEDVTWIDFKYAKKGEWVKVKDTGQKWFVKEIYGVRAFDDLELQRQDWKVLSDKLKDH